MKTKKVHWTSFWSSSLGVVYVGGTDEKKIVQTREDWKEAFKKAGAKVK